MKSLDYIVWGSWFFSVPAVLYAAWQGIRFITKKYADQVFNERLEKYKQELNMLTEHGKFDLQRKMQDFNLYTSKKHAIYAKLYELILVAHGNTMGILHKRRVADLKMFNAEQLRHYMLGRGIAEVILQIF